MITRRLAVAFLAAEAIGGVAWWCLLLTRPNFRGPFFARGAPDATLLAFLVPDALLYCGAAAIGAYGVWFNRGWGGAVMYAHAGAAGYAGLYCWTLTAMTGGDGLLGALLMTPGLIIPWCIARAAACGRL